MLDDEATANRVIHQVLMTVIRNQFGTAVESCQSIMFNVIHMQCSRYMIFVKVCQADLSGQIYCHCTSVDHNSNNFQTKPIFCNVFISDFDE
jgi:glutamine amidotransferase PdxT